jgi:AbiTii-like protein
MTKTKKIEVSEAIELIKKIKEGATSDSTPLSEVLRLCLRLGKQLGNEKLSSWALAELNGYNSVKELPDYRVQSVRVLGHFSGPFGSGLQNAPIPQISIDKEHRDNLFTSHLLDPVAELEQLSSGDQTQELQSHWPADAIAYYQRKQIYEGMVIADAWRVLSKSTIAGVLDTIRTRVLDFILSIEDELDIRRHGDKKEVEVNQQTSEKVTQTVHNVIYGGNVSVGNIGDTTQQIITVHPGDLTGLKKHLKELGVTDNLLNDLDQALEKDVNSQTQPGPAVSGWLAKIMILIGRGSLSVASNTAGSQVM